MSTFFGHNVYSLPQDHISTGCEMLHDALPPQFLPKIHKDDRFYAFACRTNNAAQIPPIANKFLHIITSTKEQLNTRMGKNVMLDKMPDFLYTKCAKSSVWLVSDIENIDVPRQPITVHLKFLNVYSKNQTSSHIQKLEQYYLLILVQTPAPVNLRHAVHDNILQHNCPGWTVFLLLCSIAKSHWLIHTYIHRTT